MSEIEICRLCANFTNSTNAEKLFERTRRKLLHRIEELIGQRLKNMKDLPHLICGKCQEQTLQAHLFRECCIQAQKHFVTAAYKNQIQDYQKSINEKAKHKLPDGHELGEIPTIEEVNLDDVKAEQAKNNEQIKPKEVDGVMLKKELIKQTDDNDSSYGFTPMSIDFDVVKVQLSQQISLEIDEKKTPCEEEVFSSDASSNNNPIKLHRVGRPCGKNKIHNSNEKKNKKHKTELKKPDYICDQCGTHFNNFTIFTTHLRRHAGEKPFHCEICPEQFLTQAQLLRHVRKHTGEKPYPCRHCQRRFLDLSARLRHERVHNNERPFACQQCGKSFTVGHTLKEHMRIHTGERPFVCKICNVSFTLKAHLVTHYRSITHKQNEEKQQNLPNQKNAAVDF